MHSLLKLRNIVQCRHQNISRRKHYVNQPEDRNYYIWKALCLPSSNDTMASKDCCELKYDTWYSSSPSSYATTSSSTPMNNGPWVSNNCSSKVLLLALPIRCSSVIWRSWYHNPLAALKASFAAITWTYLTEYQLLTGSWDLAETTCLFISSAQTSYRALQRQCINHQPDCTTVSWRCIYR